MLFLLVALLHEAPRVDALAVDVQTRPAVHVDRSCYDLQPVWGDQEVYADPHAPRQVDVVLFVLYMLYLRPVYGCIPSAEASLLILLGHHLLHFKLEGVGKVVGLLD